MADVTVIMSFVTGRGDDSQWFEWRPGFFSQVIRVEWDKDTMQAEIPDDIAQALIAKGYAKLAEVKSDEPPVERAAHKPSRSREGPASRGKGRGEVDDPS